MKVPLHIIFLSLLTLGGKICHAQQGIHDTIRLGAIVIGEDTLPHIWIRGGTYYGKGAKMGHKTKTAT